MTVRKTMASAAALALALSPAAALSGPVGADAEATPGVAQEEQASEHLQLADWDDDGDDGMDDYGDDEWDAGDDDWDDDDGWDDEEDDW